MFILISDGSKLKETLKYIIVSFAVPEEFYDLDLVILFWDEELNNGEGGWVEVKSSYWASPWLSEGRRRFEARVNRTGLYILVVRGVDFEISTTDGQLQNTPVGKIYITQE